MPSKQPEKRIHATRQRSAIEKILVEATGPLTAEEIWKRARRRLPRLGLRTVFRNLQERIADCTLSRVSFPGQPTAYEKTAPNHHLHFSCLKCARIFSLDCETPDVRPLCKLPPGFKSLASEITLFGHCPSCSSKNPSKKSA